jgi:hypothetical protein
VEIVYVEVLEVRKRQKEKSIDRSGYLTNKEVFTG